MTRRIEPAEITKLTTHQEDKERGRQGDGETCGLPDATHTEAVKAGQRAWSARPRPYTAGHLVSPSPCHLVSCYPGPVLASTLAELKAISQEFGANILEIPDAGPNEVWHVILELAGPATIILACPTDENIVPLPR